MYLFMSVYLLAIALGTRQIAVVFIDTIYAFLTSTCYDLAANTWSWGVWSHWLDLRMLEENG